MSLPTTIRVLAWASLAAGLPAVAAPHPAVCRVAVEERGGQAFGSGTLIDARGGYGLVVTNWHVVRDATGKIETRFPGGFVSEARPLKLDETWDLAALVIWRPPTRPAPLADRAPTPGERLTICGYGSGDYLSQVGRCTEYYSPQVGQPRELVELDVPARQGDSGGPIFNDRGELAGVLFGATRGTTLGSFGGRVKTFLATLAPDIGVPNQTLLAGRGSPTAPADPFQAAERTTPTTTPPLPQELSVDASVPSLADRNAAPRLAKQTERGADGWFAPVQGKPPLPFSPHSGGGTPEPAAQAPAGAIDWQEDSRTMLAVLGAAALVVSAIRMAA